MFVDDCLVLPRYLCKLTDKDLRQPDGRIMVDSMWSAVKGPVESGPICDKYESTKIINFIFFYLYACMSDSRGCAVSVAVCSCIEW